MTDVAVAPQSPLESLKAQLVEQRRVAAAKIADEPLAEGFSRLTFEEIETQYGALMDLSAHRLPDGPTEKKILKLVRGHYELAHKVFVDLKNINIKNHPVPEGWEDDRTIPIVIAERRQQLVEDLKRDTWDIPTVAAHHRLTPDDMPVSNIKGELGHQNRLAVASIKIRLGSLYEEDDDAEDKRK